MKKFLNEILLGCASFFGLLTFVFMSMPAFKPAKLGGIKLSVSVYETMDNAGGITAALIFVILATLVAICLCVVSLLDTLGKAKINVPYKGFIASGVAVLLLVAFVLFLSVARMYFGGYNDDATLGAGTVLSAISTFVMAGGLCCYGLKTILKK